MSVAVVEVVLAALVGLCVLLGLQRPRERAAFLLLFFAVPQIMLSSPAPPTLLCYVPGDHYLQRPLFRGEAAPIPCRAEQLGQPTVQPTDRSERSVGRPLKESRFHNFEGYEFPGSGRFLGERCGSGGESSFLHPERWSGE